MKKVLLLSAQILFLISCNRYEVDLFGSISGVVMDAVSNEVLSGVKVALSPGGMSQMTAEDGVFSFEGLEGQEYTLTFTKSGYETLTQKTSVKAGTTASVQVALNALTPELSVDPESLDFGKSASTLSFVISNTADNILKWKISENIDWLTCTPSEGSIGKESASVVVSVSRNDLTPGIYSESIVVTSNGGSKNIHVSMAVSDTKLEITPEMLDFGTLASSLEVTLENTSGATLDWSAETGNEWLVLSKSSGTISNLDYLSVIVLRDELSAGDYSSHITFLMDGGETVVPVKMAVAVNEKPTVTLENISDVAYNRVNVHGTIVSPGSSKVLRYGFCWSETSEPTVEDAFSNMGDCSLPIVYEGVITDLKPETRYYVRAYAENNVGLVYSDKELSFTTAGLPVLPAVSGGNINEITPSSAMADGVIVSLGNVAEISAYGHVWAETENPTLESGKYTVFGPVSQPVSYTSEITGLKPYTAYHVRAYATNEKGTAYGDEVVFTTDRKDVKLSVSEVYDIVHNAATCRGEVLDDGGHSITEKGVCWSRNENPTVQDDCVQAGSGDFTCRMTGLDTRTTYHVRAYVKTSEGKEFYSDDRQFTTTEEVKLPEVASVAVSNIRTDAVTVVSRVLSDGNSAVTECGFCWSERENPTVETGTKILCEASSVELGRSITGLKEGTAYHVRAFARNAMGISYSEDCEFTTLAVTVPEINPVSVSNIGRASAYVSTSVSDAGNAPLTECGFCWSTSPYPTVYDNKVICDPDMTFNVKLTDLPLLTTVYVRAYAINQKGTGYSEEAMFTTLDSDTDVWDGVSVATAFGGGLGIESDPIIINSAAQLALLAENVNNGISSYEGVYFSLTVNIDLDNHDWSPIGIDNKTFKGNFNGAGHSISNLKVQSSDQYNDAGLFGSAMSEISGLHVSGMIEVDSYYGSVGGICGLLVGKIENCVNYCSVTGRSYMGVAGIVGQVYGEVINCSNFGAIYGTYNNDVNVGGIIGRGYNSSEAEVIIENCANYGSVTGKSYAIIGGILGKPWSNSMILVMKNCINAGDLSGGEFRGGLLGYGEPKQIENCYWVYDVATNQGCENPNGNKDTYNGASSFALVNGACLVSPDYKTDLIQKLNEWVDSNNRNGNYKHWKYETVDGYACPVLED